MRLIESIDITPGMLTSSSIAEDDHPAWSSATSYGLGARVIKAHRVWESVQASNLNHDPESDASSTWWVDVGATNRWRAFDSQLAPAVSASTDIVYVITLNKRIDAIAMFGLIGSSVRLRVLDGASAVQYDQTFELASARQINGWWDWFFAPFELVPSLIINNVPGYLGWRVEITIGGSGSRAVGEILLGRRIELGTSLVGTKVGFRDFSVKERDQWGGWQIVKRGYSRTVDYQFSLPQSDVDRVFRTILRNRARMCVFSAGDDTDEFGLTVLGFVNDDGLSIPVTSPTCFASLSVEGLTEE
ncbi:MAG: hypothetical protein JNN06_01370 [Gemmobacter sp.]|uniref:hypothetical protein n=1 Tax=Gemmobacter sp. TaxID=1898957 RepID=UPI001A3A20C6|nr:hypothetical protein [Gemmobacter sp.]MBL8560904.1 hypothetical protein [Gemmobacter sp.]